MFRHSALAYWCCQFIGWGLTWGIFELNRLRGYVPVPRCCIEGSAPFFITADKGFEIPAEGPHRVRNLSNIDILAYRVEFKN